MMTEPNMGVTNPCFDTTHPEGVHRHGWARYVRGKFSLSANQPGHNGPDCIWCNAPTRRSGTCWVCPACGASTSC